MYKNRKLELFVFFISLLLFGFFLISYLRTPYIGTVSYEVGSASNTSYRIYQYIDGYNPKITFLSSEDTKVETKRIKDSGTVILVSGKLSSYTDTITITYDYDKKLLDKEMPTMDSSCINWINEYSWDTLGSNDIFDSI